MSTLFWLPSSGAAPITVTPSGTTWTLHDRGTRRPLNLRNVGATALTQTAYAPDAADHLVAGSALYCQYQSIILPPQAVPVQVIRFAAVGFEAVATNNLFMRWTVYAVDAVSGTSLGNIVPVQNDGTEWGLTVLGMTDFVAASTAQTLNVPWRVVLEIGCNGTPTASASVDGHNFTIQDGEGNSGHDFPQDGDATAGSTPPYLLFATDLQTVYYDRPGRAAAMALGI